MALTGQGWVRVQGQGVVKAEDECGLLQAAGAGQLESMRITPAGQDIRLELHLVAHEGELACDSLCLRGIGQS